MSSMFVSGSVAGGVVVATVFTLASETESKGAIWESVLYFKKDVENLESGYIKVSPDLLLDFFADVDGVTDKILEVTIYNERLQWFSFKTDTISHTFLIIKSQNYYWSFEKTTIGIFVQRSNQLEPLVERLGSQTRQDVNLVKKGLSEKMHMLNLFNWMKNDSGVFKCYHCITANCQAFSEFLFKEISNGRNSLAG